MVVDERAAGSASYRIPVVVPVVRAWFALDGLICLAVALETAGMIFDHTRFPYRYGVGVFWWVSAPWMASIVGLVRCTIAWRIVHRLADPELKPTEVAVGLLLARGVGALLFVGILLMAEPSLKLSELQPAALASLLSAVSIYMGVTLARKATCFKGTAQSPLRLLGCVKAAGPSLVMDLFAAYPLLAPLWAKGHW